ncbi:MAG: hypothetical protein HYZ28_06715 [Myxococcales bacterium]|nr:hypothetical protein [Myxococcales bacterium]
MGVQLSDDRLLPTDRLEVSLHFPTAGTTALGHSFRFGPEGPVPSEPGTGAPFHAKVESAVSRSERSLSVELAVPARAFPRFPAHEPLLLELCLVYEDRDEAGAEAAALSTCQAGSTVGGPLRLPDELWKALHLAPPRRVVGVESREAAWLGYGSLHYPVWVQADAPLTQKSLSALVTDNPVEPAEARIPIPKRMAAPDRRALWPVLSGADPYAVEGECNSDHELRLALYAVRGEAAERVLEWPAATCALGRAVTVALEEDGGLVIGYSNGTSATFTWSQDHFERTEMGMR